MEINFDLTGNLITMPAKLNGMGPYTLALDIGARKIIISEKLRKELELELNIGEIKMTPVGNDVSIKNAILDEFQIGSEIVNDEIIGVTKHDNIVRSCHQIAQGVVGHNFLKNYKLVLDYVENKIQLLQSEVSLENGLVPFEYIRDTHIITIQTKVNGKGPYLFILDTGASSSVFNSDIAESINIKLEKTDIQCMSPSGPVDSFQVSLNDIETQFKSMKNVIFPAIPLAKFDKNETMLAGILGYDYLKNTKLIIDYPKQRLGIFKE